MSTEERKGAELSEAERLSLLIRYQKIQDGVSDEKVTELAKAFKVHRTYPAIFYRKKTKPGAVLSSKKRSGRPTVITTRVEKRVVSEIRKNRKFLLVHWRRRLIMTKKLL
jgi:hypothetical protein